MPLIDAAWFRGSSGTHPGRGPSMAGLPAPPGGAVRYDAGVDAEELPVDDPAALARALDRVTRGEVVHLVQDGRPVADLVPAGADSTAAQTLQVARAITQRMAARFGAPTLAHYRRVYESCGQPWPGDEEIRRWLPVADAS